MKARRERHPTRSNPGERADGETCGWRSTLRSWTTTRWLIRSPSRPSSNGRTGTWPRVQLGPDMTADVVLRAMVVTAAENGGYLRRTPLAERLGVQDTTATRWIRKVRKELDGIGFLQEPVLGLSPVPRSMVIGHARVLEHLHSQIAPVTLLLGPSSVGKTTVAEEVFASARGLRRAASSVRRAPCRGRPLDHELHQPPERPAQRGNRAARWGDRRGNERDAEGPGGATARHLLHALREPAPTAHDRLPLPGLPARVPHRRGGRADPDEHQASALPGASREGGAVGSGGQIARAREMARLEESKGPVLSALHAVAFGDEELFSNAIGGKREIEINGFRRREDAFGPIQWRLLLTWAREALSGRWRTFSPAESYGLQKSPEVASRVLRMGDVSRPKVGVRCALLPFIWEKRRG